MTQKQEKIDRPGCGDGLLEPVLLDHCRSLDDLGDVRVASEVVEDAESHDPQAMLRSKVLMGLADVIPRPSSRVQGLNVRGQVLVTIKFGEVVKHLVSYLGDVQLVISCISDRVSHRHGTRGYGSHQ